MPCARACEGGCLSAAVIFADDLHLSVQKGQAI